MTITNISNNDTNGVFHAQYNYGPQDEQIIKKNILINFFQTLIARIFLSFAYPGAAMKLDQERVLKTKDQLKAIGAKFISLKTPDGDTLEAVHLKASDFKDSIEKYFYSSKEKNIFYTTSEKNFVLRDEFSTKERTGSILSEINVKPNEEAKKFIENLEGLRFAKPHFGPLPWQKMENVNTGRKILDYLESFIVDKFYGYNLPFYSLAKENKDLPTISQQETSPPTVIIAGANNTTYGNYKNLAMWYLMRGLNVVLVNPRGYGNSTGTPTSHKTKLDFETAYQYLSKNEGIENKDILIHGHCIGGGSATDLAARRKGVNLLLDRSFSTFDDQAKEIAQEYCSDPKLILKKIMPGKKDFFEKILPDKYDRETGLGKLRYKMFLYSKEYQIPEKLSKLFTKIMSWAIDYNSTDNLGKIEGKIALVIDKNDGYIKQDAGPKQLESCEKKTVIHTNVGHSFPWINEKMPEWKDVFRRTKHNFSKEFNEFLISANLYRKVF